MSLRKTSKAKSLSYYKRKAWDVFSKYIRTRDCLATTKTLNSAVCVTCRKVFPISQLQAGHAIAGRNNAILFDEELVNAQCGGCNGYKGGRLADYSVWFIKKYGVDRWQEKVLLKDQIVKFTKADYVDIQNRYEAKLLELLGGKDGLHAGS